jgi:hypothetical protein
MLDIPPKAKVPSCHHLAIEQKTNAQLRGQEESGFTIEQKTNADGSADKKEARWSLTVTCRGEPIRRDQRSEQYTHAPSSHCTYALDQDAASDYSITGL